TPTRPGQPYSSSILRLPSYTHHCIHIHASTLHDLCASSLYTTSKLGLFASSHCPSSSSIPPSIVPASTAPDLCAPCYTGSVSIPFFSLSNSTIVCNNRRSTTRTHTQWVASTWPIWRIGLCRRRGWRDPLYEVYRSNTGYTCLVLVNGREYQTDLAYESDGLAQENAAMRAFMVCRNFSVNGGMLARNGVVQGLPANESHGRHRK
ncbi:hypothetical protein DH86_00001731, partial [Scytalidium sp. 3C]